MTLDLAFGRLAARFAPAVPDPDEQAARAHDPFGWRAKAHREQLPPVGDWDVWYVRGGRGSGKSWTCSNAFAEMILATEPSEWGCVAPTLADVRKRCFESNESGLILALGGRMANGTLLDPGPHITKWNRAECELFLRNGSIVYGDGGDDGALRVQGANLAGVWADELGLWRKWDTAWDESIGFAVRKHPAKIIASGTPKRGMPAIALVKRLLKSYDEDPDGPIRATRLRTIDNAQNLAGTALTRMRLLQGTAFGRQELEGEVLDEAEGALWTRDPLKAVVHGLGLIVNEPRILVPRGRTVVSVDPSDGKKVKNGRQTAKDSDAVGFAVCADGLDHRRYVLHSEEARLTPVEQIRHARSLFDAWQADDVVVEKNHGGGYLVDLFRQVDPSLPITVVHATQGKRTRAEPIAALYVPRPEQPAPVVHIGDGHELLEDQQTTFTGASGEPSPNALDALVWGLWSLITGSGRTALVGADRQHGQPDPIDSPPTVGDDELLRMEF